jgi:hypothetical protein
MLKRLLPFAAVLMLACGGGEVSEPVPEVEADVDAPVAEAVPDKPTTHCEKEVLYDCEVGGGKHASVCNEDGWMVYRFGALGDVEAEYPAPDMMPDWVLMEVPDGKTLKFTMHDNQMLVSELPEIGSGVMVSAPDESILAHHECQGKPTTNWAKLAEVMPK